MARVFPVPAPASTQTGPRRAVATSRCSGSSPASTASADAEPGRSVVAVIAGILAAAADAAIPDRARLWTPGRHGKPGDRGRVVWVVEATTRTLPRNQEARPHGDERRRHDDDVLDELVRLLPPAQESARPRGHHLRRGRHRV